MGDSGRIIVTSQRLKLGMKNVGKLVSVIIEPTHFCILLEGEEFAFKERRNPGPISKIRVVSKREDSQKASSIS